MVGLLHPPRARANPCAEDEPLRVGKSSRGPLSDAARFIFQGGASLSVILGAMPDASIARQILNASDGAPPMLANAFNAIAPVFKPLRYGAGLFVDYVLPIYVRAFNLGLEAYERLPTDVFTALAGLALAFAGGAYCASVAAFEAVRMSGWDTTKAALLDVWVEVKAVYEANAEDDAKQKETDGTLTGQELMSHKLSVWALAIKDPEKLSTAVGGLCTAWLAAQSVLRLEFAKTVTLGVAIAEMAEPILLRVTLPFATHVVPKPYHHWLPLLVKSSAKAIGVGLAWRLQVVVSAVHLAMRGGLLFSRSMMAYARGRGGAAKKAKKASDDGAAIASATAAVVEVGGYAVAAAGFWFQLDNSFGVPFPLNVFLFPLTLVEWYIRYSITSPPPA